MAAKYQIKVKTLVLIIEDKRADLTKMAFKYADWFPKEPNIGYETLIYDVMTGDQTLFNRADMVEETWRVVGKVLDAWGKEAPADFPNYASGSDGPAAADTLLTREGRAWRPTMDTTKDGGTAKA